MNPIEQFDQEDKNLKDIYAEKMKEVRKKYNISKNQELPGEYEPGDSENVIEARKQCKDCKKEYFENREKAKQRLVDKFSDLEKKNAEFEKENKELKEEIGHFKKQKPIKEETNEWDRSLDLELL